jgi:hypothetical protein
MTWVHALQVLQLHTLQPFDVSTYVRMYLRMYRTRTNEGGMKPLWHIPMCGNLMKETTYLISIAYIQAEDGVFIRTVLRMVCSWYLYTGRNLWE